MFEDETKLIITIQLVLGVFIYGKGVASSHFTVRFWLCVLIFILISILLITVAAAIPVDFFILSVGVSIV